MKRAKERAGIDVERLGFHGQKRAGVRRKKLRALPDPVREIAAASPPLRREWTSTGPAAYCPG
ncbi:MAG: hypothetical protein GEU90_12885 [Gemmatimonas sp.]|nr:hypothetical protein [Gemmatimonas sp.]